MSEVETTNGPQVTFYSSRFCPFCVRAKALLDHKAVTYREISVDGNPELREEMMAKSGQHTVPQIWLGTEHVGGCDDLMALERSGQLDERLATIG